MGAWGTGSFENDHAADFMIDVLDSGDLSLIREVLDNVLTSTEYVEAPDAELAIVAAEIVAAAPAVPAYHPRHDRQPVPRPRDAMPDNAINLKDKLSRFSEHWSPRVIAEMNDYQFKLAKVQGEFVWHAHADTDEVFIVIEGHLTLEFRDKAVPLSAGEMYVVPKGVEHRPVATSECSIMLVEPRGVVNTGDAGGAYTARNDVWV